MTIEFSPHSSSCNGLPCRGAEGDTETHLEAVILPSNLADTQMRDLRVWSNELYALLDADAPKHGALEAYQRVQTELNRRETAVEHPSALAHRRLRFRDNSRAGRFELYDGGSVAAFLPYSLHEDRIILLETTVHVAYRGSDLQTQLIMQVLQEVDRRRLPVVAFCRYTQEFLKAFPRYQRLVEMG